MGCIREVSGIANLPQFNKFRVLLDCGHTILYDHSVDAVSEYFPENMENRTLICLECEKEDK